MPVKVNVLATTQQDHPYREFVHLFINGFTHCFHPGIEVIPDTSYIHHNLYSALTELDNVSTLLAKEVKEGYMIGPFWQASFPSLPQSPIWIATRKYTGKQSY